jgi:uncharacterized protein YecE (DUF72 family)
VTARVLLGTASWTDKPLIDSGRFYPPDVKTPEARLRYYATRYPLVEADSTYYGLPTVDLGRSWVERTPDGFTFDVKAYALFTNHPTAVARLPKEIQAQIPRTLAGKKNIYREDAPLIIVNSCWRWFVDGLYPLHEAGKLGVVVFQFPKWVFPGDHARRYFHEIRDRLGPYRAAVEFRNNTWLAPSERETTLNMLGDLDFSYICVDEPQGFQSSVPPIAAATNKLAYVRFHGRNAAMWEAKTKTSSERFDYYYKPEELAEWVAPIRQLAFETDAVHLIMNTNNHDQGPANLEVLRDELLGAGVTIA